MAQLFSLTIPPLDAHPGGTLVCTQPAPAVYLLTLTSPPDNRLTTPVCRALLEALDIIEFGYPHGVVITTSGIPKFYSNGLDLDHAVKTDGFWALLYSVWGRLLTYPMPTVALINGHAFAGGLMLATAHDYRLAPSPKGFLCVNELLFGAHLPPPMSALFRYKVPAITYRTLVLEARRFNAQEAVAAGIADGIAEKLDDVLAFIKERDLTSKAKTGVYSVLKTEMYHDLLEYMKSPGTEMHVARLEDQRAKDDERKEFGKVWYEQWLKDTKAKL
ncbi:ClpP/crotonase-like domain-containing protein [Mariannaea sp. PMI_226]|nr:ClpP/crotonase-like domain-containing protein [Mariannaea sp. PMI_226]